MRHWIIKDDAGAKKDMDSLSSARAASLELLGLSPSGLTPGGVAQHKLSRLRELRGAIDSLRGECEARDPLLGWVLQEENRDPFAHLNPV